MSLKYLLIALTVSAGTIALAQNASAQKPREMPPLEIVLEEQDLIQVKDIVPTSYWIVDERGYECKGEYNGKRYTGNERVKILDSKGKVIDTVCGKFYAELMMEGTGIVRTKGSTIRINENGIVDGKRRFKEVSECRYGVGVEDRCLLPWYTIAADLSPETKNHWNEGDIIYVPEMRGVRLPNGSRHKGFFIVRDTGEAFYGRTDRLDFFVGYSRNSEFWVERGFDHARKFPAYKVVGESKARAHAWLKQKFGDLYSARAR